MMLQKTKTILAAVAATTLTVIGSRSSAQAAGPICFGDVLPSFEDDTMTQIIRAGDVVSKGKWRKFFKKSYLDGFSVSPSGLDQWYSSGPQSKWMNAAFLVEYGINSDVMPVTRGSEISLVSRPWHGGMDYQRNAKARTTLSHFNYVPRYSSGVSPKGYAAQHEYAWCTNGYYERVRMFCPLFDSGFSYAAHPVTRAASLVHEGQHSRHLRYLGYHEGEHIKCTPRDANGRPDSSKPQHECDRVSYHHRHAYALGELYRSNEGPYQVDYEFACDLAEHANAWVPSDMRLKAQELAALRRDRLQSAALPACGNPYPLGRTSAEKPTCSRGGTCGCSAGMTLCGSQCVDLRSNKENCGACGVNCTGACAAGTCAVCSTSPCNTTADCGGFYSVCANGCCSQPNPG